jgi:hypothetical protein
VFDARIAAALPPVPKRRAADLERAEVVAISERFSLSSFQPPSTAGISELVQDEFRKSVQRFMQKPIYGANCIASAISEAENQHSPAATCVETILKSFTVW